MRIVLIKRAYEAPSKTDGKRVLADRLWPRGLTKSKASLDAWAKELAPSNELRKWFHVDREARWVEFKKRYRAELAGKKAVAAELASSLGKGKLTLLTAAKDPDRSHMPVLASFLEKNT